jgi:hypothetical protein
MALLGTREINNVEVEIHASHTGSWSIYRVAENEDEKSNERFLANDDKTLESAVNKARIAIKKQQVKVAIPFKTISGLRGVATGRHARSRSKILVELSDGQKDSYDSHSHQILKADTPKDVLTHMKELREEEAKIKKEARELHDKWKMDLGVAVDTAVEEAIKEQS